MRPRSSTSSSAFSLASSHMLPWSTTLAPYPLVAAILEGVAFFAITTVAFTPYCRAAIATPCEWLPAEEQMTPRARSASVSRAILCVGPRTLYDPPFWNISAFKRMSNPVASLSEREVSSGVW